MGTIYIYIYIYFKYQYKINLTDYESVKLLILKTYNIIVLGHYLWVYTLKNQFIGLVFREFQEGPLTFAPTYKYDPGTEMFDSSAKQRTPSYTDRILFKCGKQQILPSPNGKFYKVEKNLILHIYLKINENDSKTKI